MQDMIYEVLYYVYVLFFGVYISLQIVHGRLEAREWKLFLGLCPVLLIIQGACLQLCDMDRVRILYPLITHLPTLLAYILLLKARWDRALVSVIISYSLCQLPRWIGLVIQTFGLPAAVSLLLHLSISHGILILLSKYCLGVLHGLISSFSHPLTRFGVMPAIYYLYEYFIVFTEQRYAHVHALNEFLPTGLVLFFILFVIAYQKEMEKRACAERQNSALEMQLNHAEQEITMLRAIQNQTAIYRHDLHHHLTMISGLLDSGKQEQAQAYIHQAEAEIASIVSVRCCENETVNLLIGAFRGKAEAKGIALSVKTALPQVLDLPDTELCALLSNGLENALNAVARLPENQRRTIDIFCGIRQNKLLIEIRNPFTGKVAMKDGLPQAQDSAHGFGCRSIQSIVQRRRGVCSFDAGQGFFTLRIALPLNSADAASRP